jgi:hypothetical protein
MEPLLSHAWKTIAAGRIVKHFPARGNKKSMSDVRRTTPDAELPYRKVFLIAERLCQLVASPGGRILVLLFLVIAGYTGAAFGVRSAESGGAAALIALLLVLARHPASPGFVGAILGLLKK